MNMGGGHGTSQAVLGSVTTIHKRGRGPRQSNKRKMTSKFIREIPEITVLKATDDTGRRKS